MTIDPISFLVGWLRSGVGRLAFRATTHWPAQKEAEGVKG